MSHEAQITTDKWSAYQVIAAKLTTLYEEAFRALFVSLGRS